MCGGNGLHDLGLTPRGREQRPFAFASRARSTRELEAVVRHAAAPVVCEDVSLRRLGHYWQVKIPIAISHVRDRESGERREAVRHEKQTQAKLLISA
jgi:hypothetical protein